MLINLNQFVGRLGFNKRSENKFTKVRAEIQSPQVLFEQENRANITLGFSNNHFVTLPKLLSHAFAYFDNHEPFIKTNMTHSNVKNHLRSEKTCIG